MPPLTAARQLELFLADEEWPVQDIAVDEARRAGIRLHRSAWGHAVVEAGVACASVRLATPHRVFIGAHSYVNDGGYLRGPLFVGRYCSIGRRVSLGAAAHRMTGLSTSPFFRACVGEDYGDEETVALFGRKPAATRTAPTVIGHDVWIGDGAVVGAGVRIGHGAIIGANVVVTRDLGPYAIVRAGQDPATAPRQRFPDPIVARLLAAQWWEADRQALRSLPARHVLQSLKALESLALPASPLPSFKVLAPAAPPV
jgi:virginiamycin A acetyltransferase